MVSCVSSEVVVPSARGQGMGPIIYDNCKERVVDLENTHLGDGDHEAHLTDDLCLEKVLWRNQEHYYLDPVFSVMANDHFFPIFSTFTGEPTQAFYEMRNKLPNGYLMHAVQHISAVLDNKIKTELDAQKSHLLPLKRNRQYIFLECENDDEFGFYSSNYDFVNTFAKVPEISDEHTIVAFYAHAQAADVPHAHYINENELAAGFAMASDFFFSPPRQMCKFNPYTASIVSGMTQKCHDEAMLVGEPRSSLALGTDTIIRLNEKLEQPGLAQRYASIRDQAILLAQKRSDMDHESEDVANLLPEDQLFQTAKDMYDTDDALGSFSNGMSG